MRNRETPTIQTETYKETTQTHHDGILVFVGAQLSPVPATNITSAKTELTSVNFIFILNKGNKALTKY